MADTFVQLSPDSTGKKMDTRTESTNAEHRQVMVIGDPATNAGVAPVDVTKGLAVDLTATGVNSNKLLVTPDLPSGASTGAKQDTGNTSVASIDTKTPALGQALAAGSVPVILPSATITTLTPPAAITGFALDTSLTTIDTDLKSNVTLHAGSNIIGRVGIDQTTPGTTNGVSVTDGTNIANVLKSDGTAAGQNAQITAPSYLSVAFTTTTVQAVGATDAGNYDGVAVQISSQGGSSTVTFQVSNDNATWVSKNLTNQSSVNGVVSSSTATGLWVGSLPERYFRLNVTGIASGTTAGTIIFSSNSPTLAQLDAQAIQNGTWTVGSNSATASAVPANAFYQGVNPQTALPTAATVGNLTGVTADKFGRTVVLPGTIRDLVGTQTTTITASTSETTVVTAAASIFNDLTALVVSNTSGTATRVDFRDTTAGSILFSIYVPASDVRGVAFNRPVPQTTVNTNWTAQSSASITDLRVYAVFDKNK